MPQSRFLIQAFDLKQWCPVLQAMFLVDDRKALRAILAGRAGDDPEAGRIAEFNRFLRGSVEIVARRDGATESV